MSDQKIPAFVFKQPLPASDRPTAEQKSLEVVMYWGSSVIAVEHYDTPRSVTIGVDKTADFVIGKQHPNIGAFQLIEVQQNQQVFVRFNTSMLVQARTSDGVLHDTTTTLESAKEIASGVLGLPLHLHDRIAVQIGQLTFVVQYVAPAKVLKPGFFKTVDYAYTRALAFTFAAHALLILLMMLMPEDPNARRDDLLKNANHFAQLMLKKPEKIPEKKKTEVAAASGAKAKKDEGKFGKEDEKKPEAAASKKGAPKVDVNKREEDRKIAMRSGLFKALDGVNNTAVSNVLGPGGLGTGINSAMGGLRGSAQGQGGGHGGLGTRGTGAGGGGNGMGIGGIGSGNGIGPGGPGGDGVALGGRGKGQGVVVPGRTITKGCLSQEAVMRVLGRAQSQAKYCYEKELNRNPNLAGKITTSFVIEASGAVQSANVAESTMGNPDVESCLIRVVTRLRFPPCEGGGVADVTYPWIFKSGGNE